MTCQACAEPNGALYLAGCRGCQLRAIACGPHFFASLRAQRLTAEYQALLKPLGDMSDVHREVKAVAKTLLTGAQWG